MTYEPSPFVRLTEQMELQGYQLVTTKGAPAFRDDTEAVCSHCASRGLAHRLYRRENGTPPLRLFSICRHCHAVDEVEEI